MSCPSDHYHRTFVTVTVLRMEARSLGYGRLEIEVDPTATSLAKTISDWVDYGPPQLASLFGGQARIGHRMRFVGVVIQRNLRSAWVLLWKCHWGC